MPMGKEPCHFDATAGGFRVFFPDGEGDKGYVRVSWPNNPDHREDMPDGVHTSPLRAMSPQKLGEIVCRMAEKINELELELEERPEDSDITALKNEAERLRESAWSDRLKVGDTAWMRIAHAMGYEFNVDKDVLKDMPRWLRDRVSFFRRATMYQEMTAGSLPPQPGERAPTGGHYSPAYEHSLYDTKCLFDPAKSVFHISDTNRIVTGNVFTRLSKLENDLMDQDSQFKRGLPLAKARNRLIAEGKQAAMFHAKTVDDLVHIDQTVYRLFQNKPSR